MAVYNSDNVVYNKPVAGGGTAHAAAIAAGSTGSIYFTPGVDGI